MSPLKLAMFGTGQAVFVVALAVSIQKLPPSARKLTLSVPKLPVSTLELEVSERELLPFTSKLRRFAPLFALSASLGVKAALSVAPSILGEPKLVSNKPKTNSARNYFLTGICPPE